MWQLNADRVTGQLQNFLLDVVNLLVYVLKRAEELELPTEVIGVIQTSLQLLGNTNAQNTVARRKALLVQMNPRLKDLVRDGDFKEAAPMLFGNGFRTKERLAALMKMLGMDKPRSDFYKGCRSGHYKPRGWQPSSSKTGHAWCTSRSITITAEHLPGSLNTIADQDFRSFRDCNDWMLNPTVFQKVAKKLGPLEVDLFASCLTKQLTAGEQTQRQQQQMHSCKTGQNNGAMPIYLIHCCLSKVKLQSV